MLVLGLQGSPRRNGNTSWLLNAFMEEARNLGAATHIVDVDTKNIRPCRECTACDQEGVCSIDDDMKHDILPLLRRADVIVPATPMFFYHCTAQLKALIDRTQPLWGLRHRRGLSDPGQGMRRGFLLALGATRGNNLFTGLELTMRYFCDAAGASYQGGLTYRGIEHPGDMETHPTVMNDIRKASADLLKPLVKRKKVLFACRENACRSQMAAALTQVQAGDRIDAYCAGSEPAKEVNPVMTDIMREMKIDMSFRIPRSIDNAVAETRPDLIVTLGCGEACPYVPGAERMDWNIPDPAGKSIEFMRGVRETIKAKVQYLIDHL